jgi:hypothetical protein
MTTLLSKIKAQQPGWFGAETRRFFNDIKYYAYRSKITNKPYLVRSTYVFSDMFGNPRTISFRVNPINPDDFDIMPMTDDVFETLQEAKTWVFEA